MLPLFSSLVNTFFVFFTNWNSEIQNEENNSVSLASKGENDLSYAIDSENIYYNPDTGKITGCDGSVTSINIPPEINGLKITSHKKVLKIKSD